jgi:hypothetical protein
MARPLRPHAQVIAALALPLLLGGCSGTPFGERLSRAFPAPGSGEPEARPAEPSSSTLAPTQTPTPVAPVVAGAATSASAGTAGKPPTGPGGSASLPAGASKPITTKPVTGGVSQAVPSSPGRPGPAAVPSPAAKPAASAAPYRVTIRLPQADPAAPAEVVTQALRSAGVPFEVETIERIAPAAPTAPAPAVRPAPAPRP